MNCREAFERLSADVDGELPPAEAESLRRHLQCCDGCAHKRALLESTRQVFRSNIPEPVSANFADAVIRRVHPRIRIGWWLSAAAVMAAVLALVLLRQPERPPRFGAEVSIPLAEAPSRQPGWNEGRMDVASDCGLPRARRCVIDMPCGNGDCSPPGLVSWAGFAAAR
jgi:anti-sigma factor RsiW